MTIINLITWDLSTPYKVIDNAVNALSKDFSVSVADIINTDAHNLNYCFGKFMEDMLKAKAENKDFFIASNTSIPVLCCKAELTMNHVYARRLIAEMKKSYDNMHSDIFNTNFNYYIYKKDVSSLIPHVLKHLNFPIHQRLFLGDHVG